MEQEFNKQYENPDPWREAILAERKYSGHEPMLVNALNDYGGKRDNALILGDASLVQAEYLLEKKNFIHIIDVDVSPTLLDDEIIQKDDTRLERIVLPFDQYDPSGEKFDLIYGKSIAFNPKETIQKVLQGLSESLNEEGIFFATWGAEGDSYRHGIFYSLEEINNLYSNANLEIIENRETDKPVRGLLGHPARAHRFDVLAKKRTSDL